MPLSVDSLNSGTIKTESLTVAGEPVGPKYKVYTALLTQSGGDDFQSQSSGAVQKGVTYYVDGGVIDVTDFSNVGGQFQTPETGSYYFVATIDGVPNEYGGATADYNTGAPVVTVLENTIGNVWFTYSSLGSYAANSDGLFISNKTTTAFLPNQYIESPADIYSYNGFVTPPNAVAINSFVNYIPQDSMYGAYASNSIEIRVYN